jgi:hypothetical protein
MADLLFAAMLRQLLLRCEMIDVVVWNTVEGRLERHIAR